MRIIILLLSIISIMTGCSSIPSIKKSDDTGVKVEIAEDDISTEMPKEPEDNDESNQEEVVMDLDELDRLRVRNEYGAVLTEFLRGGALPDGYFDSSDYDDYEYEDGEDYDWQEGNEYAFADVNGDGREELLLSLKHNYISDQMGYIYEYNSSTKTMINEMIAYPIFEEVYNNGVIKMGISHNQGLSGDVIWPYNLCVYDSASNTFKGVGEVEAWDGNKFPTDYSDNPFPTELDKDGDGTLYSHEWDEKKYEWKWIDNAEYEQWLNSYIGDADLVQIEWKKIGNVDWGDDVQKLKDLIINYNEMAGNFGDNDIGYTFIKNAGNASLLDRVEDIIRGVGEKYGMSIMKNEEGMEKITASIEGSEVLFSNYDTLYALNYANEQIGDVTILGIYPGMPYDEAKKRLENMYFYNNNQTDENENGSRTEHFKTGEEEGNYIINLECEAGIVKIVSINERYSF